MKKKTSITYGLLTILMFLASVVAPFGLGGSAPVEADPGIMRWSTVNTPGSYPTTNDILFGSEINTLAVGPNGSTILAAVTTTVPPIRLYSTGNGGMRWSAGGFAPQHTWDVAIAPDDSRFRAVVTSSVAVPGAPVEVRITSDGGTHWYITGLLLAPGETIRAIDISPDYGGTRDIAVATVTGAGGGDIYVLKSNGFGGWLAQGVTGLLGIAAADYYAVKFSPTYSGDSSLAFVYATPGAAGATFYNIALRDIDANATTSLAFTIPASRSGIRHGQLTAHLK